MSGIESKTNDGVEFSYNDVYSIPKAPDTGAKVTEAVTLTLKVGGYNYGDENQYPYICSVSKDEAKKLRDSLNSLDLG